MCLAGFKRIQRIFKALILMKSISMYVCSKVNRQNEIIVILKSVNIILVFNSAAQINKYLV